MTKNNKPVILYVLIGLLVVAIAIGPIYSALSDNTHEHAFDFSDVSEMGQDGTELIYRYHPDCGACQSIEGEVNDFQEDNAQDLPLRKVHVSHEENLPSGLSTSVPSLLIVENGQIQDEITGANDIPAYFDEVNAGD